MSATKKTAVPPAPTFEPDERIFSSMAAFVDVLVQGCQHGAPEAYHQAFQYLDSETANISRACGFLLQVLNAPALDGVCSAEAMQCAKTALAGLVEMSGHLHELSIEEETRLAIRERGL